MKSFLNTGAERKFAKAKIGKMDSQLGNQINKNRKRDGFPNYQFRILLMIAAGKRSIAVLLDSRGAQPRKAEAFDRALPSEELLHRQRITPARVFQAQQAAPDSHHDFRLAPNDPPLGIGRRQISQGERTAIGSDHVADARPPLLLAHFSHNSTTFFTRWVKVPPPALKKPKTAG